MKNNPNSTENTPQLNQSHSEKPRMAFLQVPVAIEKRVRSYIDSISDTAVPAHSDELAKLPSQGCFLVIPLEKIERIINTFNRVLKSTTIEIDQELRKEINETLKLLS